MILESFVAVNGVVLASRMVHTKVEKNKQMTDKILSEGIYHITTPENADKIIKSNHIRPSSNIISMGRKKCFFFAGAPTYDNMCSNCADSATKYEFTTIKIMPNKEEISSFKQRSLNDDAITYLGKCNLPTDRAKIVQMVLDLDENNKIISREKSEEEIQKGKYVPSNNLLEKLKLSENSKYEMTKKMGISYFKEFNIVGKKIYSKINDMLKNINNKNTLMLDKPKEDVIIKKDEKDNKFIESLEEQTISSELITYSEKGLIQEKENELKR